MAADDDDSRWGRQLLVALGALVAISLIIGSVIAVVALGAAKVSGIGEAGARASATPSLFIPPLSATASDVGPSGGGSPTGSASSPASTSSGSASPSRTAKPKPKPAITLRASPTRVSSSQRINFRGSYRRDGRLLQVQRYEGGHWADFPTTATVRGGTFTTYIFTGRSGLNRFRVVDQASGQASNTVRITVR